MKKLYCLSSDTYLSCICPTFIHAARAVHKNPDEMRFLYDILPEKVKVKDYLASLHLQDRDGSSD